MLRRTLRCSGGVAIRLPPIKPLSLVAFLANVFLKRINTVLTYQMVKMVKLKYKSQKTGSHEIWTTIKQTLGKLDIMYSVGGQICSVLLGLIATT